MPLDEFGITDDELDKVTAHLKEEEEFIELDDSDNSIVLKDITSKNEGTYPVIVELVDEHGIKSKEYKFNVIIEVEEVVVEIDETGGVNNGGLQETPDEELERLNTKTDNCTAKIVQLSYQGLLQIEFTTDMNTLFNHSLLNDTIVDIYVRPSEARMNEEDFNISLFNLTYNVTKYEEDSLDIQLYFDNALEMSRNINQDMLVFHVKNRDPFFTS